MFHIIYPENRLVDAAQIQVWFADAVANEEIDEEYLDAKGAYAKALALQDAGIITLGR